MYLSSKFRALLKPGIWQRTSHTVEILHVKPCKICGTTDIIFDFFIGIIEFQKRLSQNLFLSHNIQNQINSVHRAPVQKFFIFIPVPECHGIRIGTEVQRITQVILRFFYDFASHRLQLIVINAGDGGHQHPTQTLTDLLTIYSLKQGFDNLTIGLCGDLKFGRTVHSLIHALIRYPGIKFVLISPEELKIPDYIREDVLKKHNVPFTELERLEDAMPDLDILYMTRVQKERFFNEEDYVRMKDFYILTKDKLSLAKEDMLILHPLPRVNEISVEVDDDPRAVYFKQAQYGVYVRMALILTLLKWR